MCSDHVYLKKDGRIRPDLSDWWLPGPPPCLPHAGVSFGEEGEGEVVVLRARSPRVGLACELDCVTGALPYKKVIIRRLVLRLLSVLSTAGL